MGFLGLKLKATKKDTGSVLTEIPKQRLALEHFPKGHALRDVKKTWPSAPGKKSAAPQKVQKSKEVVDAPEKKKRTKTILALLIFVALFVILWSMGYFSAPP